MELILLPLLIVLVVFGLPITFAVVTLSRLRRAETQLKDLTGALAEQRKLMLAVQRRLARLGPGEAAAAPEADEAATRGAEPELPLGDLPASRDVPASVPAPAAEPAPPPRPAPANARMPRVARAAAPAPKVSQAVPPASRNIEEALTSGWLVWLGALAVGLSAVFLFSYAIEQGWLGPVPRVVLGLLLGAALIGAGDWVHRRPTPAGGRLARADVVPPALTASGLFALFVSLFAAHALYGLVGAWTAFATLAAVGFLALALALRQGWFVALQGLVGGFAVPALLTSETADALPVFLYIWTVTGACLGLMVWRKWWWLSFATLAGALAWPLAWLAGPWVAADQGVLGSYAVGLGALFAILSVGLPVKRPGTPATAWLAAVLADTSGLGYALSGALVVLLALVSDFNAAAFVFIGLHAIVGLVVGLRRAAFEGLAVIAALVTLAAFLVWPAPHEISVPAELARLGVDRYATAFGPYVMPPEFVVFARSLLGFAVIFGLGGFLALRWSASSAIWSAISAAMPVALFVIGYWRIGAFEIDVQWAALAAGLGLLNLAAAALLPRLIPGRNTDVPLALHAAGCTAALALAFTGLMREAWLTVAISLEVVALAWLWTRLRVEELRLIAYAAVAVVIVRLTLNHRILDYDGTLAGVFGWVVYGYGIPAAAFLHASRLFRRAPVDPLATLCEVAGTAFAFLLVALQLRLWTSGAIDDPRYGLFDQSVQSIWWLVAAGLLLRRELAEKARWPRFGGLGLLALACLQIGVGQVVQNNPVLAAESVGTIPILNLLGLGYLLPAALLWGLGSGAGFLLSPEQRQVLRIGASGLLFVFVTLQVRHLFWGSDMRLSLATAASGAEIYAYSAAWIVYALALLAVGIVQRASFWRYSSLAVLIVTLLKVFLYDMSDLTGLFRVASFLGLGLALIGIGYVYRHFVFRP